MCVQIMALTVYLDVHVYVYASTSKYSMGEGMEDE